MAIPVGGAAALLALGRRDGVSLDRLVLAAVRQRMTPRYRVAAPEGVQPAPQWLDQRASGSDQQSAAVSPAPLRLPAQGVTETGVVDLGADGVAAIGVCSTVNFALRTSAEQGSLVGAFGRYLHSLTAPVQVLVRAERLDLSAQISELRERAPALPHPALETAAREHADYLDQLGDQSDLLRRQVLLVLREPLGFNARSDGAEIVTPLTAMARRKRSRHQQAGTGGQATRRAAEARLMRRLTEAVELLGPIGIVVTPLDAGQATAILAAACNPDSLIPPSSALAGAGEVITTVAATPENWPAASSHPPGQSPSTSRQKVATAEEGWEESYGGWEPT